MTTDSGLSQAREESSGRTRRRRLGTRGALLFFLALGLVFVVIGIVLSLAPPPTTPDCNGSPMSPGDACREVTYQGSSIVSDQTLDYDQVLAQQRDSQSTSAVITLGIGGTMAAASLGGVVWSRRRHKNAL